MSEGAHESPDTGAEQRPVDPVRLAAEMIQRDWQEAAGPDVAVPTVEELLAGAAQEPWLAEFHTLLPEAPLVANDLGAEAVVAKDQDAPPDGPLVSGQHRVDAMAAEMDGTVWPTIGEVIQSCDDGVLIDGVPAIPDTSRGDRLEDLGRAGGSRVVVTLSAAAKLILQPWLTRTGFVGDVGSSRWFLKADGELTLVLHRREWSALATAVTEADLATQRTLVSGLVAFYQVSTPDEPDWLDLAQQRLSRPLGGAVLLRLVGDDQVGLAVDTLRERLGWLVEEVDALGEPPVPVFEVRTARGMAEGYAASFANANQGPAPAPREPDSPTGNSPGFGWLAVLDWELKQALRWVGNVTGETEQIDGLTLLPVAPHTWPDLQRQAEAAGLMAHRQHWRAMVEYPPTPGRWKGFPVYRLVPAPMAEYGGERVAVLSAEMWPAVARFMSRFPALHPAQDQTEACLAELPTTKPVSVSIVVAHWPAFAWWASERMGWTLTPDVDDPQVVHVTDTREG